MFFYLVKCGYRFIKTVAMISDFSKNTYNPDTILSLLDTLSHSYPSHSK